MGVDVSDVLQIMSDMLTQVFEFGGEAKQCSTGCCHQI
jgi:hypothetical protein